MSESIHPFYFSAEWIEVRNSVRSKAGYRCYYCDDHPAYMVDHVIPRHLCPDPLATNNLVCCCALCNQVAGAKGFKSKAAKRRWVRRQRGIDAAYVAPTKKPKRRKINKITIVNAPRTPPPPKERKIAPPPAIKTSTVVPAQQGSASQWRDALRRIRTVYPVAQVRGDHLIVPLPLPRFHGYRLRVEPTHLFAACTMTVEKGARGPVTNQFHNASVQNIYELLDQLGVARSSRGVR